METPKANASSIASKGVFGRGTEEKKELDSGLRCNLRVAPKHWLLHFEQAA